MKRKNFHNTACLILIVGIFLLLLSPVTALAWERLVRIHGDPRPPAEIKMIFLEPDSVAIEAGTVVIWYNKSAGKEIKLSFESGKICKDTTESHFGFNLQEATNCFVTDWIPMGATSSLRFMEKGVYEYTVEGPGGIKTKGKIEVKW